MEQRDMAQLTGEVHIDGAYVNGIRNKKADRIDRRLAIHQKAYQTLCVVFCQRALPAPAKNKNQRCHHCPKTVRLAMQSSRTKRT